ncbi:hypothetical protein [uncultured Deefgea sp.]|uniref:hypothetical protein n=1 Tax=uncultured Deefgea sp. TaxID=1304914 RepID=UPI002599DDDF|nr:hypothetical protein [uncultured Deefgea sp.]
MFIFLNKMYIALAACREANDKPAADRIFASETDKKRGIYSRSLAREGEPNKKNLREQARAYARF